MNEIETLFYYYFYTLTTLSMYRVGIEITIYNYKSTISIKKGFFLIYIRKGKKCRIYINIQQWSTLNNEIDC